MESINKENLPALIAQKEFDLSKEPVAKSTEEIRERLKRLGVGFEANANISEFIHPEEVAVIQSEVQENFQQVLNSLVIDTENDHNTTETAKRVAKMYVREVFSGRFEERPDPKFFPNAKRLDEIYTLGPFDVRSACSHHLVPILGKVWFGVKPGNNVIGISKFSRIAEWICARPHIQEEMIVMLADELEKLIDPAGIIVVVKAQHMCMTWRGVKEMNSQMTNSIVRGEFRYNPSLKQEFFSLIEMK